MRFNSEVRRDTQRLVDFFFFFQAEDGIRDLTVTGVQTCALPISKSTRLVSRKRAMAILLRRAWYLLAAHVIVACGDASGPSAPLSFAQLDAGFEIGRASCRERV